MSETELSWCSTRDRNSKSKGLLIRGLFATPALEVEIAVGGNANCPGIDVEGGGGFVGGPSKVSCTGGNQGIITISDVLLLAC